jgi:putative phosphoribosyl transferase
MMFADRADAGIKLAERLGDYTGRDDVIVWGLPRGGVIVALEVARALGVPLDVSAVRKLGVPDQPELAMGAVAAGGVRVLNHEIVAMLNIDQGTIDEVTERAEQELERQQLELSGDKEPLDPQGKTVILVDDGLATGATMRAVIEAAKRRNPAAVVVAVPVAPPDVRDDFRHLADDVVCVATPEPFYGVGAWYRDFRQTTNEDVRDALLEAQGWHGADGREKG